MFLVGIVSWWYGRGWSLQFVRVRNRLRATAEFFSIGQLAATLFAPFRQISAGRVDGPIGVMMRALLDQLVSRTIGGIIRTMTILIGIIVLAAQAVYEVVTIVLWLLLPTLPIVGVILFAIGWVPSWR